MSDGIEEIIERPSKKKDNSEPEEVTESQPENQFEAEDNQPQDIMDSSSLEDHLSQAPEAENENYGPSLANNEETPGGYASSNYMNDTYQSMYQQDNQDAHPGHTYSQEAFTYNKGINLTQDSYES